MRWGIGDSRGKIPNTSQTCCALHRPRVSAASAAPLPATFCSASLIIIGGEGRGEGAVRADGDAQPGIFHLPSDHFPMSFRLARFPCPIETLSGEIDALSDDISTLTGNLSALSRDVNPLSGHIDALSPDINAVSDDIFGLSGDIFTLTGDIFGLSDDISPQFHRSKPLTHS